MNLLTTFYLEFLHMVSYACASCTQSAVNILRVVQGTIILLSYSLSLSLSLSLYMVCCILTCHASTACTILQIVDHNGH